MKFNKNRQKIFDYIESHNEPINPQIVVEYFKNDMDQATVYRNLNYLEKNQYIEGFIFSCIDSGTAKFYYPKNKHHHFLHCKVCHHFQKVEECTKNRIEKLEEKNNIKIESHVMYYTGICNKCL